MEPLVEPLNGAGIRKPLKGMVGAPRFELGTSCSRSKPHRRKRADTE